MTVKNSIFSKEKPIPPLNQIPPPDDDTPPSITTQLLIKFELFSKPKNKFNPTYLPPAETINIIDGPLCLVDQDQEHEDIYHIKDLIGKSFIFTGLRFLPVHRAVHRPQNQEQGITIVQDSFVVSLKYVLCDQEPDLFHNLKSQVDLNGLIADHPNVLSIKKPFMDADGEYFCVVFPFMDKGSLRSLMAARYPNGLPEVAIVIALKEVLKALSFLHGNNHLHREISAGHIFLNSVPEPEIKLAYSASVYDQETTAARSPYLPMECICSWAGPPESFTTQNMDDYTEKCDVWLFGITALELACGGLKFKSRVDLEIMVEEINETKKIIPAKEDHKKKRGLNLRKLKMFSLKRPSLSRLRHSFIKKRDFSKKFEEIVVRCLDLDPAKRPTVDELLGFEIFEKMNKGVGYFHDNFVQELMER